MNRVQTSLVQTLHAVLKSNRSEFAPVGPGLCSKLLRREGAGSFLLFARAKFYERSGREKKDSPLLPSPTRLFCSHSMFCTVNPTETPVWHAVGKVCIRARRPIRPVLNCSMKQLGILLLPPGWNSGPLQG